MRSGDGPRAVGGYKRAHRVPAPEDPSPLDGSLHQFDAPLREALDAIGKGDIFDAVLGCGSQLRAYRSCPAPTT
jgi:hypothetical protein